MDDLQQQQIVKARLEEIYRNQSVPEFVFKGKQVSFWKKQDAKGKKRKTEPADPITLPPLRGYSTTRRMFQVWSDANALPMPEEQVRTAAVYAGFSYKDDNDVIKIIHKILILLSNFAICETLRKIVRIREANHNVTNCLETLVNLMRAQLTFDNLHSQQTYLALVADAAHRLHQTEYQHYLTEAVQIMTAGINLNNQSLTHRPTRHVGILFPCLDYYRKPEDNNLKTLEKLHQAIMASDENGGMDFKPVLEAHRCTQDLLYHNYWSASRPRDEDYVDDVAKLIFNNKDVFGIDKPVDCSNRSVHQYEDVDIRDIKHDRKTFLLCNCNESHVSGNTTMDKEFCLTCGAPGHNTTDHESTYQRVKKTKVNTGKPIVLVSPTRTCSNQ